MHDGTLYEEGNLRLLSQRFGGLPTDLEAVFSDICAAATQAGLRPYGPLQVWFDLPPDDTPASSWSCQVGSAVIGQPPRLAPLLVEDYHRLQALRAPFMAPLAELAAGHRHLADQGRAMAWSLRPYWRLDCSRHGTSDGHLLPDVRLSVFVDR